MSAINLAQPSNHDLARRTINQSQTRELLLESGSKNMIGQLLELDSSASL